MSETSKSPRREALFYQPKNGFDTLEDGQWDRAQALGEDYKQFLTVGKTERLSAAEAVRRAEARGFSAYRRGLTVRPGDKLYHVNRDKAVTLIVVGRRGLEEGIRLVAAHIDAPRLDVKPRPLYEDSETVLLKTHYYGGIKKYQWVALPLELHGVVVKADGTAVPVSVGAAPDDPVFTITDLLPHLAGDQMKKNLREAITGESLNVLIGTRPDAETGESRVKLAVLALLHRRYGITEADFLSAELSLVPALPARDVGLDASLIGGYGHDDRVCGFVALRALLDLDAAPEHTAVCLLADKEEIGSEGVTGMRSAAFDTLMADLCAEQGVPLGACFASSFCLSADVCNAFDPNYPEVSDKTNAHRLNYGLGLMKYTGVRGKAGASDASAETVGRLRGLLERGGIRYQFGELGKVDQGGGGTVAVYMAQRNIEVVDAGVPVLSMHSPFEIISKLDLFETYRAALAVYGD
ncbi:MAG: aminopeptidase [Oscillospiraceae bacterium]|jgi:aspartyl aminopeptidase|nr:aminopeptidase [Oscillospiraceae bacterium]